MKYISILLLFFWGLSGFSQISFMPAIHQFNDKYPFYVQSVLDCRQDTTTSIIGILKDSYKTISLASNVEFLLNQNLKSGVLSFPDAVPVIFKINELQAGNNFIGKELNKEILWLYTDYEVFIQNKESKWVRLLRKKEAVEGVVKNSNYQGGYSKLVWYLLNEMLTTLRQQPLKIKGNNPDKVVYENESALDFTIKLPPILTDSIPKGGIYMSYQEFLENKPSVTDIAVSENFVMIRNPETNKFVYVNPKDKVWGFSDGYNIFVNHENKCNFVPIQRVGTGFITAETSFSPDNQEDNNRLKQLSARTTYNALYNHTAYMSLTNPRKAMSSSPLISSSIGVTANAVVAGAILAVAIIELIQTGKLHAMVMNNGELNSIRRVSID